MGPGPAQGPGAVEGLARQRPLALSPAARGPPRSAREAAPRREVGAERVPARPDRPVVRRLPARARGPRPDRGVRLDVRTPAAGRPPRDQVGPAVARIGVARAPDRSRRPGAAPARAL